MAQVVSYGLPHENERSALEFMAKELGSYKEWLFITNFGGGDGLTREIDAVLFAPGVIIGLELKSWEGSITVTSSGPWKVVPAGRYLSPDKLMPLAQAHRAVLQIKNILERSKNFDANLWRITEAVVITTFESELSFSDGNELNFYKVFKKSNFVDGIDRHIRKFHSGYKDRARRLNRADLSLVLERLKVPQKDIKSYLDFVCAEYLSPISENTKETSLILNRSLDDHLHGKFTSEKTYIDQAQADFEKGCAYAEGKSVQQDYRLAFRHFESAAQGGHSRAMFSLGCLYEDGLGVSEDCEQARKWYKKAVSSGSINACYNLGILYEDGRGGKQDYTSARKCYIKGADAGDPEAMSSLASFLQQGLGGLEDHTQARFWYSKAIAAGNQEAIEALQTWDAAVARDKEEADTRRIEEDKTADALRKEAEQKAALEAEKLRQNEALKKVEEERRRVSADLEAELQQISTNPFVRTLGPSFKLYKEIQKAIETDTKYAKRSINEIKFAIDNERKGQENRLSEVQERRKVELRKSIADAEKERANSASEMRSQLQQIRENPLADFVGCTAAIYQSLLSAIDAAPNLTRKRIDEIKILLDLETQRRASRTVADENYQNTKEYQRSTPDKAKHSNASDKQKGDQYKDENKVAALEAQKDLENGMIYFNNKNSTFAISCFMTSAERGNSEAMIMLGNAYRYGEGVLQDYDLAIAWYAKAASAGHPHAKVRLNATEKQFIDLKKTIEKSIFDELGPVSDRVSQDMIQEIAKKSRYSQTLAKKSAIELKSTIDRQIALKNELEAQREKARTDLLRIRNNLTIADYDRIYYLVFNDLELAKNEIKKAEVFVEKKLEAISRPANDSNIKAKFKYESVILKQIGPVQISSESERKLVYDYLRSILIDELSESNPDLTQEQIEAERLAFAAAVNNIEISLKSEATMPKNTVKQDGSDGVWFKVSHRDRI